MDEWQMPFFSAFDASLISLNHQLRKGNHTVGYLRDRLMSAIDLPKGPECFARPDVLDI